MGNFRSGQAFLTSNPATLQLLAMVDKVAPAEVPVLVTGESGTGKELIARRIHEKSKRSGRPMVSVNCGAIQESLLLSELFGHERGSFTGAYTQKKGLAETANGGTLFLDEIGEMGLEAQTKLLRFLQEGEVYRVGGREPIRVSCRIIAATNRNLEDQIKLGRFREDLYYRLNTFCLHVLPLRKRPEDVPLLVGEFLRGEPLTNVRRVSPEALRRLIEYPWPGNVRELHNLIHRVKVLAESDTVEISDLPPLGFSTSEPDLDVTDPGRLLLEEVERRHIVRVLSHFKGNKTRAASAMGITVKTLYNKLAAYGDLADGVARAGVH